MAVTFISAEEEKALAQHWKSYAWWHGVPNFWMLRDPDGMKTAGILRDEIRAIAPSAKVMVVECSPKTWAGASLDESNREWLRKFWPPEGD